MKVVLWGDSKTLGQTTRGIQTGVFGYMVVQGKGGCVPQTQKKKAKFVFQKQKKKNKKKMTFNNLGNDQGRALT